MSSTMMEILKENEKDLLRIENREKMMEWATFVKYTEVVLALLQFH